MRAKYNQRNDARKFVWGIALARRAGVRFADSWPAGRGPSPGQIKNLVTFGDSYTDVVSRMQIPSKAEAVADHQQVFTGDNGISWPIYAAQDGNFKLFLYARAGATCSNNITFRPFPSLFESQLPLYLTEIHNGSLHLNPAETVNTLWIGTNDVGVNSLLVGEGTAGSTVVDTTTCAVNWVKTLYASGARNFLFQNVSSRKAKRADSG